MSRKKDPKPEKTVFTMPRVCAFITEMRKKRGLTKTALAIGIDKTQPYITQIESGMRTPNLRLTKDILNALEATPEERETAILFQIHDRSPEVGRRLNDFEKALHESQKAYKTLTAEHEKNKHLLVADKKASYNADDKQKSVELWDESLEPFARKGAVVFYDTAVKPKNGDLVVAHFRSGKMAAGRYFHFEKKSLLVGVNPVSPVEPMWADSANELGVITGYLLPNVPGVKR